VVPSSALVYFFASPNTARLFAATAVGYYLLYEWLHISYHVSPGSFVGRLAIVRALRKLHTAHHDLTLMGKYNFNITFPIGDWLFGTRHRASPSPAPVTDPGPEREGAARTP
jgi:sterol desaturase/sphingolipid hydroxylase (fatty acid hydroxylase superfamily)